MRLALEQVPPTTKRLKRGKRPITGQRLHFRETCIPKDVLGAMTIRSRGLETIAYLQQSWSKLSDEEKEVRRLLRLHI